MTKLPKIGARYKNKRDGREVDVKEIDDWYVHCGSDATKDKDLLFSHSNFNLIFGEIPEEPLANAVTCSSCDRDIFECQCKLDDIKPSKPKSIWKPVSELPDDEKLSIIIELESGEKCFALFKKGWGFCEMDEKRIRNGQGFQPREIRYCLLTDFINQQERMKLDIEKLYAIIKEGK